MSVFAGLTVGVSALNVQSRNFAIISDNIANVNTVGYKDVEARFTNFVTDRDISSNFSPGGVAIRPFLNPQRQGQIQASENNTNVAITGNGFFVGSTNTTAGTGNFVYTRSGAFEPDQNGDLVNTAGYFLQGWLLNDDGTIVNAATQDQVSSLQTVNIAGFSSIADETQNLSLVANLPATAVATDTETTNVTVFDSIGNPQTLQFTWTKSATANEWNAAVSLLDSSGTATAIAGATFDADFNPDGTLNALNNDGAAITNPSPNNANFLQLTIPAASLAANATGASTPDDLVIDLNLGTPGAVGTGQADGLSQFASPYELKLANQDGSAPSGLESTTIDDTGLVTAVFTNGETRPIYRIPLATFPAPTELGRADGNAFTVTADSGDVVLNTAGTGAAGFLESRALEASTADIAEEFADLIIAQRAYSAATRIITTGDEMLTEAINLKR
ncbi:MAG: flagellar hook protein FlgE [Alphaproteobacteria bacterium]|nr:flagellar hook protein FlgE [Alphaproteobacteria bacterium]